MSVIKVTKTVTSAVTVRPVTQVAEIQFLTECFCGGIKGCELCQGKVTVPGINKFGMLRADQMDDAGNPKSETYFTVTIRNGGLDPFSARTEYLLSAPEITLPADYPQYAIPGKQLIGKSVYQVVFKGAFARGEESTAATFVSQIIRNRHRDGVEFPYTVLTSTSGSTILVSKEGMKHLYGDDYSRSKIMKLEEYGRLAKLYKAELVKGNGKYKLAVIGEEDCKLNPYKIYKPGNGGSFFKGKAYYENDSVETHGIGFAIRHYKDAILKGTISFADGKRWDAKLAASEKLFGFKMPHGVNAVCTHEFVKSCSAKKTPIHGSRDSFTIEIDIKNITPISIPNYGGYSGSARIGLTGAKYEFDGLPTWIKDMVLDSKHLKRSLSIVTKALNGNQPAMRLLINQGIGENSTHLRGVNMEILVPQYNEEGVIIGGEFKLPNDSSSRFDIYQSVLSYVMDKLYKAEVDGVRNQLILWDPVLDLFNAVFNKDRAKFEMFVVCPHTEVKVGGKKQYIVNAVEDGMDLIGKKDPVPSIHNFFAMTPIGEKAYYQFYESGFENAVMLVGDDNVMLEGPSCIGMPSVLQLIGCLPDLDGDKIAILLSKTRIPRHNPVDWEKDEIITSKKDLDLSDDRLFMEWVANCNMTKVAAALAIGFGVKGSVRGALIRLLLTIKAGKKVTAKEANSIQEALARIAELDVIKTIKSKLESGKSYKSYTDAIDDNGDKVAMECLVKALGLEYAPIWDGIVKAKGVQFKNINKYLKSYMNALSCRDGETSIYDEDKDENIVVPSSHPFDRIKMLIKNSKVVSAIDERVKVTFPAMYVMDKLATIELPRHISQRVVSLKPTNSTLNNFIVRNASDSQKQNWVLNRALELFITKHDISEDLQLKYKTLSVTFVKIVNTIYREANESFGSADSWPKTQFIHDKMSELISNCTIVGHENTHQPWVFGNCSSNRTNVTLFTLMVGVECTTYRATRASENKEAILFEGSRLAFNKCPGSGIRDALCEYYMAFNSLTVSEYTGKTIELLDRDGDVIEIDDEIITVYDTTPLAQMINIKYPSWVNKFVFGGK